MKFIEWLGFFPQTEEEVVGVSKNNIKESLRGKIYERYLQELAITLHMDIMIDILVDKYYYNANINPTTWKQAEDLRKKLWEIENEIIGNVLIKTLERLTNTK